MSGRPLRLGRNAGKPGLFFLYPGGVPLFWMDPASQYDRAVADASSKNRAGGAALLRKKADFKSIRTGHTSIFSGTCDDVSGI